MIEIAFDKHLDRFFDGQEYPLLDIPNLLDKSFDFYIEYAKKILASHSSEKYLMFFSDAERFNTNKLALAFFVVSCLDFENSVECLVIKSANYNEEFEGYKPYVAVSIGVKYVLRLIKEPVDVIYKELKCLDYLGFSIKEDYVQNSICYSQGSFERVVTTNSVHDALVYASLYKILALAKIDIPFKLIVNIIKDNEVLQAENVVSDILHQVSSYIDI